MKNTKREAKLASKLGNHVWHVSHDERLHAIWVDGKDILTVALSVSQRRKVVAITSQPSFGKLSIWWA